MKIFFVARGVPSERDPQWGNFEYDQALALRQLGHNVVILSVDTRFRKYYRKLGISKEIHGDIWHYNLFVGSIIFKFIKHFFYISLVLRSYVFHYLFKKVVQQEGLPDLIYSHYLSNTSRALAAKQKYGIPVVGIEHWSELGYETINNRVKLWAEKTYKGIDCLLTVSNALRNNIKYNIGFDSIVVNNMVGNEFFFKHQRKEDSVVKFVTTGNLLPVKGFDILIEAFNRTNFPAKDWSLTIIGAGKEREQLQSLIDNYLLSENIHLVGRKKRKEVVDILNESDIYVMSSRSETFGVAAIEAMACGLPIIATRCGGTAEFVKKENGLICPVGDVLRLSEALVFMFNHYKEYDKEWISCDCRRKYSSESVARQLESIFIEVVNKNKKR